MEQPEPPGTRGGSQIFNNIFFGKEQEEKYIIKKSGNPLHCGRFPAAPSLTDQRVVYYLPIVTFKN